MPTSKLHDVQPERGKAVCLSTGEHLKIINTHGTQVVDMWAFNAADLDEIMSMHHTKSCLKKMMPAEGEPFMTYKRRPILTLVEDHSPGIHDTVLPACDKYRYTWDGVAGAYHNSCGDNLVRAMDDLGFTPPTVTPQPFQVWMNIRIRVDQDGRQQGPIDYLPPASKPGDYIIFRAELDCVVAMSACPYDLTPAAGNDSGGASRSVAINGPGGPTEVHYQVY